MKVLCLTLTVALALVGCGDSSPAPSGPTGNRVISLSASNSSSGLTFGDVLGGANLELTFAISNSGTDPLVVSAISVPTGFTASWTSGTVAPGQVQNVTVRFTPTYDQNYSGTLTVTSNATGGSSSMPISARGIRTGRVSDPVGDIQTDPRVAIPPDLVEAGVTASGGVLLVTLTFASGTVTPQSEIHTYVVLDTDENPSTGFPGNDPLTLPGGRDSGVIGLEYYILLVDPRGSTGATIWRVEPDGRKTQVGSTGVTFQGPNQFVFGVPLSLIGGDDGRLGFKVMSGKWTDPVQTGSQAIRGFDTAPNEGLPPGLTP